MFSRLIEILSYFDCYGSIKFLSQEDFKFGISILILQPDNLADELYLMNMFLFTFQKQAFLMQKYEYQY